MSHHKSHGVMMSHHESWWINMGHDESPLVTMSPDESPCGLDGSFAFIPRERRLTHFENSWYDRLLSVLKSSAFALDRLFWPKNRLLWPYKIICFCSDRLISTWIVCFDPEGPSTIDPSHFKKGEAMNHGRLNRSCFWKGNARIHGRQIWTSSGQIWTKKYGLKSNTPEKIHLKNADQYENVEFRLLNYQLVKSILTLNYSKNRIEGPLW